MNGGPNIRHWIRITLAGVIAAATGIVLSPIAPAGTATALDAFQFTSVKGVWGQDSGDVQAAETTNAPDCLAFGRDTSSSDGSFTSGQNTNAAQPTVRNQVRFGHPSNVGNNECGNVNDRSGFGFAGVSSPSFAGLFEIGRFTHFNRPIQSDDDNAGTAKLDATFRFNDETTATPTQTSLTVEYEVELDETPNGATPCAYGGANNQGVNINGCADRIQISVANQNITRTIGNTSITFEIGGFGPVVNNSCGTPQANGNVLLTPEGGEQQACVFGQPARGTLIINKSVQGGGSGSYPFRYREISQKFDTRGQEIGSAVTTNISVTNGTGTSGPIQLPPGLYNLSEITGSLGSDVDFASLACTTNGQTATLASYEGNTTSGANAVVDLDSNETITCTFTNRRAASVTIVKDTMPNNGQDFAFTTTSTPGTPNSAKFANLPASFSLDDDGDATLSNTLTQLVDAGTYTVTESLPAAGVPYRLGALTCSFARQSTGSIAGTNLDARTASLTLQPGDDVTCTFRNDFVAPPSITVAKTPASQSFSETSGSATYNVAITNSGTERIRVTELRDLVVLAGADPGTATDANLADAVPTAPSNVGGTFTANTCDELVAASAWIEPGATINCSFTIAYTDRDADEQINDTVTVTGTDDFGRTATDDSSAITTVTDREPVLVVDKLNVETTITAPGGIATYDVRISNGVKNGEVVVVEAVEDITILSLADQLSVDATGDPVSFTDIGQALDITTVGGPIVSTTCTNVVGDTLEPYESITCRFAVDTTQLTPSATLFAGDTLRNTVTVVAEDDEGNDITQSDTADRDVVVAAPVFTVFKTDGGAQIVEPGAGPEGRITYTFWIDNIGQAGINEPLTITGFSDEIFFEGASIGTISYPGPAPTFSRPGVALLDQTCSALIGTTLQPSTGTVQVPGVGSDAPRDRPANLDARAECTIELQLPGNAGQQYDDIVTVIAEDPAGNELPPATNEASTPIVERPPSITVTKTANPTTVPEPGADVTFTFVVTNTSGTTDPVTITEMSDAPFGDLFAEGRTDTTCQTELLNTELPPGGSDSCTLTTFIGGNAGDVVPDVVTVRGRDDEQTPVEASDDAAVTVTDVRPTIAVTKTAVAVDGNPVSTPPNAQVSEYGGQVTFEVVVSNLSPEPVFLTQLTDTIGATTTSLDGAGTCAVDDADTDVEIAVGGTYTCTFTLDIAQVAGELFHENVVTAVAEDDEGNETPEVTDPERVEFDLEPPVVTIDKDDKQESVTEPGGTVTYFLTISNGPDAKEAITAVESLTDTITYAIPSLTLPSIDLLQAADVNLNDAMTRNTCPAAIAAKLPLAPGASFDCEFDIVLSGTAQFVDDIVRIVVSDDDDQSSPEANDTETTPITDDPIDFRIEKTASPVVIANGASTTYTFTIHNESTFEDLYVVGLVDDQFGDLSNVGTCSFSEAAPVIVGPGESTSCEATLTPVFPTGDDLSTPDVVEVDGVHDNVASARGGDDEIFDAITDDDPETTGEWLERSDDERVWEIPTLTVAKVDDVVDPVEPGDVFTYSIAVTNGGPLPVANVEVSDAIPDELTVLGVDPGDGWSCAAVVDNELDCTYAGPLAASTMTTVIEVEVRLAANFDGTEVVNTAVAIADVVVPAGPPVRTPEADDTELTPVESDVDLTVTKDDGLVDGALLEPGSPVTYTIQVQNVGNRDLNGDVTVTDVLPPQFSWASPLGDDRCDASGQTVTCIVPADALDGNAIVTIEIDATVNAGTLAGVYTNLVYVDTDEDPICEQGECPPPTCPENPESSNVDCEDTPVDNTATLSIVKSDWTTGGVAIGDTDSIEPGDSFTYRIMVTNNGPQPVKDIVVTDTVPDVLSVGTLVHDGDWSCAAVVDNEISCTYAGPLAASTMTSVIEVPVTLASNFAGTEVTNTADAEATIVKPEGLPQNDKTPKVNDPETTLVDSTVDLTITKDDDVADGETVTENESIVYTITVANDGNRDLNNPATVTDVLPDGIVWDDPLGDDRCDVSGQTVTCEIPAAELGAGDSVTIELNAIVEAGTLAGVYTNLVYVDTDEDPICEQGECPPPTCPENPESSNVDCEDTPVDNTATLSIVKDDDASSVEPGDSFTYTILVTNNGPQPVDNIVVTDTVPAPLTIDAVGGTDWNCSTVANAITCTRAAELGAQVAAPVITVDVTLSPTFVGTTLTNTGIAIADVVKPDGFPPESTDPVDDDVITPVKSLDVSAFLPTCVADSPYIVVDIDALGFEPGDSPITLTFFDKNMNPLWIDADGNIVAGPVAGGTPYTTTVDVDGNPLQLSGQRVLFPGASLDPLDWPGWVLDNGVWVEDPSDDFLRDGVFIQVDINPTALTGLIEYPPAISACANPEQTEADLAIVKDASVTTPVGAGNSFDWELEITNNGPDPAVDVVVTDLVPAALTVTGVTSSDFTCTRNGNNVTCNRDTLAVGASGTITIQVSVPANATSGQITNVATVESNVPDPNLTNNSDDASVTVVEQQAVTTTSVPPPATLPPTGSNSTHQGIVIALWLLAGGVLAVGITRRRRTHTVS